MRVWLISMLVITTSCNHVEGQLASNNPPGFISIDCGANENYTDNSGIYYQTDAEFISTGETASIAFKDNLTSYSKEYRTLRYFPKGKKNCYTLKPEQGKNNSYLIRASFLYGNYDGKNQPPADFDLFLGVDSWASKKGSEFLEIVYTPSTDIIYVCLVNTNSGTPFISALELRPLDNSIYNIRHGALHLYWRKNLGGSNGTIRFPDDIYDRKWYRDERKYGVPLNLDFNIDASNDTYKLPPKVWGTAVESVNNSIKYWWKPQNPNSDYYVYLHFAEIEQLKNGQQRTIHIQLNDRPINANITLEYLKPFTASFPDWPVSGSVNNFSISTMDNDPPPILNAYEVYRHISIPQRSPTVQEDVDAILEIKENYMITDEDWQGDPCVPIEFTWNGLACTSDDPQRIISLNLSSRRLTGNIAISFSKLKYIQSLDLSYNNLKGPLPEALAKLPSITVLNLTGNQLEGSVPKLLMEKSKNGSLTLKLDKNPKLCSTNSCEEDKKKKVAIVLPTVLVPILMLLCALAIFWCIKRKRQREMINDLRQTGSLESQGRQCFTHSEILKITNNYASRIGGGGFGNVYHGTLENQVQVAVKLLKEGSKQGSEEFQNEVDLLMRVHHRNLVSLIGHCEERDTMALVYEFVGNGNLHQHLSAADVTSGNILTWEERLQIAVDAARGLDYLHNGCKPPIVHRDLKTSNILLNENLQANIGDFGLSKVLETESATHTSTDPKGTYGYLDPEYYYTGKLNKKSDVYSFGVLLLELITGRATTVRDEEGEPIHLSQWVISKFGRMEIESILDSRIQSRYSHSCAQRAIEIAVACMPSKAIQRPDIMFVYNELKECLETEMASERTNTTERNDTSALCTKLNSERHTI